MFAISAARHDIYGMPTLSCRFDETQTVILPSTVSIPQLFTTAYITQAMPHLQNILFAFNAQHDCHQAKCTASGQRFVTQERLQSTVTEQYIVHEKLDKFIINTHSFHNAHLLRAALPRELIKPIPFSSNCREHHNQLASVLRGLQDVKRATTAAKVADKKRAAAADSTSSAGPSKKRRVGERGLVQHVDR